MDSALIYFAGGLLTTVVGPIVGYRVGKKTSQVRVDEATKLGSLQEREAPLQAVLKALERRDAEVSELRVQAFNMATQRLEEDRARADAEIKVLTQIGDGVAKLAEELRLHREEESRRSGDIRQAFHETQMIIVQNGKAKNGHATP